MPQKYPRPFYIDSADARASLIRRPCAHAIGRFRSDFDAWSDRIFACRTSA